MNSYSVGPARSIFDWAALRDEFRIKLELLDLYALAVMYGLSRTVGYRDDDFVQKVEDYLATLSDPIRARFDLAYLLGSSFWDAYSVWSMGPMQPGEPGYIGELLDELHDTVMTWLLDGLSAYSDIPEVMDNSYYLVSRIGMFDTFLKEQDIPLLESAAQKEISLENSEGGKAMMQHMLEVYKQIHKKNDDENDRPDVSAS